LHRQFPYSYLSMRIGVIKAKNNKRCHKHDTPEGELYSTGREKGREELLLESGLGVKQKK